jgi:hypothetical protein
MQSGQGSNRAVENTGEPHFHVGQVLAVRVIEPVAAAVKVAVCPAVTV